MPQDFDGQEVFEFFLQQIRNKNYRTMFQCQGRECGNSAYWANTVFENRILYGPETNQYFAAVEVPGDNAANAYLSIYVTTRTNRRIYAHIEVLEESGAYRGSIVTRAPARKIKVFAVQGITFDADNQIASSGNLASIVRTTLWRKILCKYML